MHALEVLNVALQKGVDRVFVLFEGWVFDALAVVGNHTSIFRIDEFDQAVDEISKVSEELRVVFSNKVFPNELGVSSLWTRRKKVVTPYLITQKVNTSVLG